MKFAVIHAMVAEKAPFRIARMCRLLGVTRQGYYKYVRSFNSPRVAEEEELREQIVAIHQASGQRYGSPRIHRELRRRGKRVSKSRVERTMRGNGLVGAKQRVRRTTTKSNATHPKAPNVLNREFEADAPNRRWVTDITYVWTHEGWAYVAAILDLFSRRVVGWAISASLSTDLPLAALHNALVARGPTSGLLHHSDRGCQYTSSAYREVLAAHGIVVSMSRRGNCWDNAVAESFFATLKCELIEGRTWKSRAELRAGLFEYLETFYNRRRLHSALDYRTPAEVEAEYLAAA